MSYGEPHNIQDRMDLTFVGSIFQDTPITAGREGVAGRMKSQTVKVSFTRIERFVMASSSIISADPLSISRSENDGNRSTLLKDEDADLTLST